MKSTNSQRFYDLGFVRQQDGTVQLTQTECGESSIIYTHPEQLKFISRRLCGMDNATDDKIDDLERKLSILASDIDFIVHNQGVRSDIIAGGSGNEFVLLARLDALWDLAMEFDGGRLLPRESHEEEQVYDGPVGRASHK
jgi:hypothetical protein